MYDLDNYMGITLTSSVYKIYMYSKILEEAVMTFLEDNAILGEVKWGGALGKTEGPNKYFKTTFRRFLLAYNRMFYN
jgi:hypothetical protein